MDALSDRWLAAHSPRHSSLGWNQLARAMERAGIADEMHVRDAKDRLVAGKHGMLPPRVVVRISDRLFPFRLMLHPSLAVGEAYMDGRIEILSGSLRSFLSLGAKMLRRGRRSTFSRMSNQVLRSLVPTNGISRARRNARHHYDLPSAFYRLFLDQRMQYSCAYFRTGEETIDEAQAAKIAHIAAKLDLQPGQSLLDIGCGWGTLALALAEATGVEATGITLAPEQIEEANRLASRSPVAETTRFELADYREWSTPCDRIVSVGMLEHVGRAHLRTYFRQVARLLKPGGVALIHAIGRWDGETGPDPWTDRYIFPGGHIPSLSEVLPAVEHSGLKLLDLEVLRLHYALTLERWASRFANHRDDAEALFGERFCRMWEFYLAAAETGFRRGQLMVFQLLLGHERDALPLTRDYICEAEGNLSERVRSAVPLPPANSGELRMPDA